ncbi:MAG TPA: ABC transporter permease [Candidatus Ventrousia excrementavium]|uniref:ABC transporter permease n=1 Tax=Candidatus Ventrousia excrementavium TaxID=2840961 RepID=A0A9D1LJD9_9CLOT|nr:ABC transporter permease [Candidatus Ventrousia excrementavium]
MLKYLLNRIWQSVIVLVGVTLVTFILLNVVPGDPVLVMLNKRADAETVERVRHELGLDRPLHIQYFDFVAHAVQGDLGESYFQKRPVTEMLNQGFALTFRLGALSLVFSVIFGLLVGTLAALFRGRFLDHFLMFIAMLGISMPIFWLGVLLQILLGLNLGWLPISGTKAAGWLVMPVLCLGISYGASASRLIRTNMLDALGQDYVRTARAKGLSEWIVVGKHVLKNAAIPIVTLIGMQLRSLLAGAMVIEMVFSLHGLGRIAFSAVTSRDIPIVQGCVLYTAAVYVIINLIVDLLYGVLDPRIRIVKGAA